jgi:hypothetical protein
VSLADVVKRRTVVLLWLAFAFVTWNVVYDREVAVASLAFTRDQVVRYQQRQPVISIDEGFSPHVRAAALRASGWAGAVLALGAAIMFLTPQAR